MRIGLIPDNFLRWQGGRDFFSVLADSVNSVLEPGDEVRIISVVKRDRRSRRAARIAKHFLTRFPPDLRWAKSEVARLNSSSVPEVDSQKLKVLSELSRNDTPDVIGLLHGPKPSGLDVACVAYIYDCQHLRLPEYFSSDEIVARNTLFAKILHENPVVVVHSESVKSDLQQFFPRINGEILSLPFLASAFPDWLSVDSGAVRKRYGVPPKYFLCSNQFWQHKNHETVVDALALARVEKNPISIVFTGPMEDWRAPGYVPGLMRRVQKLGVRDDCIFLGLIPKLDQIAIMKSAVGIIQPTLFEGSPGGGAVRDAISVGTPVVVSDIPINREIESYVDAFFSPRDPASLLEAMRSIESANKEKRPVSELLAEGQRRRLQCGKTLKSAFALAMCTSRRPKIVSRQDLAFLHVKIR